MARPKKTAEAATPNTSQPAAGHNGLSPDRHVELTMEARRMKRAVEEASGKYRAILAKLHEGGVDMKSWRHVEALSKLDKDEREQSQRNILRYASFLDLPMGAQAGIFSDDAAQPSEKTRDAIRLQVAEDDGYFAGREGAAKDTNPKEAGTPHHVAWDKGWRAGEAAAVEAMKTGEVKKRGRQAASGNPEDRAPSA